MQSSHKSSMSTPFDPTNTTVTPNNDDGAPEIIADSLTMAAIVFTFFCCCSLVASGSRRGFVAQQGVPAQRGASARRENSRRRFDSTRRKSYLEKYLVVRPWNTDGDSDTKSGTSVSVGSEDDPIEGAEESQLFDDAHGCAICMMNYKEGDLICESNNLQCKHVYHKECMTSWLKKHEDCPLCRETYVLDEV